VCVYIHISVCVYIYLYIPGIVGDNGGAIGVVGDEEVPASEVVALVFVLPTVPVIGNQYLHRKLLFTQEIIVT
jgi:hypothetical protein